MESIRLLQITSLVSSMVTKRDGTDRGKQTITLEAQDAVSQENRLAAVDYSLLSRTQLNTTGTFTFTWEQQEDGSATLDISYQSNTSDNAEVIDSEATSNFSLRITINADGSVVLPEEIEVDTEQIQGEDFVFTKTGVLQLLNDLAEQLGTEEAAEVDISGKLDEKALAMLKRLGLIDEDGKATQLLQFLSEFAGLNRFKAGQQVGSGSESGYGISEKSLNLQRQMMQSLKLVAALSTISSLEALSTSSNTDATATEQTSTATAAVAVVTADAVGAAASEDPVVEVSSPQVSSADANEDSTSTDEEEEIVISLGATGQVIEVGEETEAVEDEIATLQQQPVASASAGSAKSGAAGAQVTATEDEDSIEAWIESLEAVQEEKEQQAEAAQRKASQAAIAAARARLGGKSAADIQSAEQDAAMAMQAASQAQAAAAAAAAAVQSAKLQQQQLSE